MEPVKTPSSTRATWSPAEAVTPRISERNLLHRENRTSVARPAGTFRALENHSQSLQPLERAGRIPEGPGRIQEGCRPRVEHGRRFLRQGAPRRRRWKRGAQIQAIGRSRGGLTTKIHALVDGLGNPLHVHLTAGSVHDVSEA